MSDTDVRLRRKIVKTGLWIIAALFAISFVSGTYGIPRIIRLELERKSLLESNRKLVAELIDAGRKRDMLKSDRTYIEYIARTRYHMVYPNETVYRYRGQ